MNQFEELLNNVYESYSGEVVRIELVKKESINLLHKLYKDIYVSNNIIFGKKNIIRKLLEI